MSDKILEGYRGPTPPYLDITQPRIKPLLEKVDKNYPDNTITKEYLKYLDDTYPFYPLTNDTIIKYLAKENPKWFLCFNVVTCHLGLDKINEEIIFHDKEINRTNKHGKNYNKDFFISIGNINIDCEVNSQYYSAIQDRNDAYIYYSKYMDVKNNKDLIDLNDKSFYQLNLNTKERSKEYAEREFITIDKYTGKLKKNEVHVFVKYLEMFYNLYYNHNEVTDEVVFLASLKAKSYEELYEILSHVMPGRMLSSFIESVVAMVKSERFSKEWFTEIYAEKVKEENDKLLKEEGRTEGLAEGRTEGIKLGALEKARETAKNLLSMDMDIKDIIKATGLEESDILNLQNKD